MLRIIMLAMGVTAVATLGVIIDAQSRPPVRHLHARPQPPMIHAQGRIEGASREIELRPQLAGRITSVLVEEAQSVEAGDVLLRLDDREYRCATALAAAELELAKGRLERLLNGAHPQQRAEARALYQAKLAELERARLNWQRISDLREAKAIAQQEADNQRTLVDALTAEVAAARARLERLEASARADEVHMAKSRVKAAEARLELAKVREEKTALRAPCRGQILKIDCREGELSGPDAGDAAIIMANTTRYYVRAFVEELDAPRVKLGMTATITADGLSGPGLKGRVARISPRMGRKQLWSDRPGERHDIKTREIWIELENREPFILGLRVDVVIDPESSCAVTMFGSCDNPTLLESIKK